MSAVNPAEQNMHFCFGIASQATVIDQGQIVYHHRGPQTAMTPARSAAWPL
jgi:ABC-type branched-subunit amino acid transport system ATPase component